MTTARVFSILLLATLAFAAAAAEDDLDDNDDLKPTPEELARQAVLKRWPDAIDIEVVDAAAEEDEAEPAGAGDAEEAEAGDDEHFEPEAAGDDADDEEAYWTISVTFSSKDVGYQVLVDDDGRICYVYEEIDLEGLPQAVLDAVHAAAEDADVECVEKMRDETKDPVEELYVVGLADRDLHIRPDGTVKRTMKFAAHQEDDDADHEEEAEPEPEDAGDRALL